jgi:hypothetical protein
MALARWRSNHRKRGGLARPRTSSHPAPAEARMESARKPKLKIAVVQLEVSSPFQEMEVPKIAKIASVTPKRRRMASVLDTVMESTKASIPASAEAPSMEGENTKKSAEAGMTQVAAEAEPLAPAEARPSEDVEKGAEIRASDATKAPLLLEKERDTEGSKSLAPRASTEELEFIVRHA